MAEKYIITIDQGTTGSRVYLINKQGESLGSAYEEFKQYFPKAGWVEHDAEEIYDCVEKLIGEAISEAGVSSTDAVAIGITNQRETTVIWDRETGKPVHKAIVWQCRRTAEYCDQLKKEGHSEIFRKKTGLVIDAYFSGTKIKWLLDNVEGLRERAEKGELLFGTIDTWLLYRLTGGIEHKTDYTNASRTLVYNIHDKKWDSELLNILGIPDKLLPEVVPTAGQFGKTLNVKTLPDSLPIMSMVGDQQSALYGQLCHSPGEAKSTYGTGSFVVMNLGDKDLESKHGLLTTLACDAYGKPVYALEGAIFIAGAVIQWLRDSMHFFRNASDSEGKAAGAGDDNEVVFVPAFSGLGAPYWDQNARGAILGLTRDTSQADITRAALKSIAMQVYDVLEAMRNDSGLDMPSLKVDGGAVKNRFLMQFQADILQTPVIRPHNVETTLLGAAYLAGIASGFWSSPDDLSELNPADKEWQPASDPERFRAEIDKWHRAVKRVLNSE